jgi:hypothetical protein
VQPPSSCWPARGHVRVRAISMQLHSEVPPLGFNLNLDRLPVSGWRSACQCRRGWVRPGQASRKVARERGPRAKASKSEGHGPTGHGLAPPGRPWCALGKAEVVPQTTPAAAIFSLPQGRRVKGSQNGANQPSPPPGLLSRKVRPYHEARPSADDGGSGTRDNATGSAGSAGVPSGIDMAHSDPRDACSLAARRAQVSQCTK